MKRSFKALIVLCLFSSLAFGGVWSSMNNSGMSLSYANLQKVVSEKNTELMNFYNTNILNLLNQINEQSKKKEQNLKALKALQKELLVSKEEINFLLKQHNELLSIKANANAL